MRTPVGDIAVDDDIISRLVVKARQQFEIRAWQMPEAELPADLLPVADPVFWWHEDTKPDVSVNQFTDAHANVYAEPHDLGDGWWGFDDGAAYNPAFDRTNGKENGGVS